MRKVISILALLASGQTLAATSMSYSCKLTRVNETDHLESQIALIFKSDAEQACAENSHVNLKVL